MSRPWKVRVFLQERKFCKEDEQWRTEADGQKGMGTTQKQQWLGLMGGERLKMKELKY